jgi:alkylated DNA repair dioxygenase AlkB
MSDETIIETDSTLVMIYREYISNDQATRDFNLFRDQLPWNKHEILVYGKHHLEPRLSCAFGDGNITHNYANTKRKVISWNNSKDPAIVRINEIKLDIETNLDVKFNSCLFNYYRNGQDYIAYHSDKEISEQMPIVVGVSFGGSRDFYFKTKAEPFETIKTKIDHGDVMIMYGDCQKNYTHSVPKRAHGEPRISITFRQLA